MTSLNQYEAIGHRQDRVPLSGRQQSTRLLFIHIGACIAAGLIAFLFKAFDLHLWPCAFHAITGYYCLSCGSTRAVIALLQLDIASSFLLNPMPLMIVGFMATVMGFEVAGILKNKRYPFRWLPHVIIGMLAVLVVFFFLRNFGFIPRPETIYVLS